MKRILQVGIAAVALMLAGTSLWGQSRKSTEPIINFGIAAPQSGVIKSWSEGVSIKVGGQTEVVNGPFGTKALRFTGGSDAMASFQLDGDNAALRNAGNISISFSVRLDSQPGTNDDTGLGLHLNGYNFYFGNDSFKLAGTKPLEQGKWYQMAFSYSVDNKEANLYVNGVLDRSVSNVPLKKLGLAFDSFGKFAGSVSSIQVWNRALPETELLKVTTDEAGLNTLRAKIEEAQNKMKLHKLDPFLENVKKKIAQTRNQKRNSVQTLTDTENLGITALWLAKGEYDFRDTSLADAPFALVEVQPTAKYLRNPKMFPEDAIFTANLCVAAARGEYEPFSFMIYAYEPISDFKIELSDFKSEKGATLPSSIVDRKIVKYWYQASWNSPYNSNTQILVPDLLLNDDSLIKTDDLEHKNYLRVNGKYVCVNSATPAEQPFNFLKEDVRDAERIQPVTLVPGESKQFWFTAAVPVDAKPGLYTSTATASGNGKNLGSFTVKLRVYPFVLPDPKTCYDHKRDYLAAVCGAADLARYAALTDGASAEKFFTMDLKNLKAHGIAKPAIPFAKDASLFEKDLKLRKDNGFDLKDTFVAAFPDDGSLMTSLPRPDKDPVLALDAFKANASTAAAAFAKTAGHKNFFFYGIGEGAGKQTEAYRNSVLSSGCKVLTSGAGSDAFFIPCLDLMHAQPYAPDDYLTEKWHAMHGRIVSCGGVFAGPDNPDIFRRFFGVNLYRASYDGFLLPSAPDAKELWNERTHAAPYRNQTLFYPTVGGPINTIAFEGLREGLDDVRYISMMRLLLDEAYASKNWDGIYAGKKAVGVFELLDTKAMNLDLMRREVADHIVTIMKRLGKDVE